MEIETLSMEYVDMKAKQIWLGNSLPAILSFCISTVCVYSPPWSLLHTAKCFYFMAWNQENRLAFK